MLTSKNFKGMPLRDSDSDADLEIGGVLWPRIQKTRLRGGGGQEGDVGGEWARRGTATGAKWLGKFALGLATKRRAPATATFSKRSTATVHKLAQPRVMQRFEQ